MGLLGKVIYREDDRWPFSYVYFDGKSENELQKELFDATDMLLSQAEVRQR